MADTFKYTDATNQNQKTKETEDGKEKPQVKEFFTDKDANDIRDELNSKSYRQAQRNAQWVYNGDPNPNDLPFAENLFDDDDGGYTMLYDIVIKENGNTLSNAQVAVKRVVVNTPNPTGSYVMNVDLYIDNDQNTSPRSGIGVWNLQTKELLFTEQESVRTWKDLTGKNQDEVYNLVEVGKWYGLTITYTNQEGQSGTSNQRMYCATKDAIVATFISSDLKVALTADAIKSNQTGITAVLGNMEFGDPNIEFDKDGMNVGRFKDWVGTFDLSGLNSQQEIYESLSVLNLMTDGYKYVIPGLENGVKRTHIVTAKITGTAPNQVLTFSGVDTEYGTTDAYVYSLPSIDKNGTTLPTWVKKEVYPTWKDIKNTWETRVWTADDNGKPFRIHIGGGNYYGGVVSVKWDEDNAVVFAGNTLVNNNSFVKTGTRGGNKFITQDGNDISDQTIFSLEIKE